MHTVKSAASIAVALLLSACGGPATEESLETATDSAALTSASSRGCTFSITYQKTSSTSHPPLFEPVITREASSTCPWWPSASVVLTGSFSVPALSIAANDLGVVVSYTYDGSPSGSNGEYLKLLHLAPDTLSVVRSTTLSAYERYGHSSVYIGELSLLADGTTLQVQGSKEGIIPFELGSGTHYIATYPDFFTSTTEPSVVAY